MTEYTDSMAIYNLISGIIVGPSQISLLRRFNSLGQGNHSIGVQASPSGPLSLFLPFGASIFKTVSHQSKYTWGCRLNMSSVAGVGGGVLVEFLNCAQQIVSLKINANGSILVYGNNTPSTVICQNATANLISANTNCYVEFQCITTDTGSDINAACIVKIDNSSVASGNANIGRNKNTLVSQQPDMNQIGLYSGVGSNGQAYMWDIYLTNGAGPTNTGFLGSSLTPYGITSQPILPNSDGGTLQWTPASGSVHYNQVNELPADDGTTYNASSTSTQVDSLGWQPIPTFTGTVKSVQLSFCAMSTDEGNCILEGNIGAAGAEEQTNPFGQCSSWEYFHQAFDTDPATGVAWVQSLFNAKEFGYQLQ